MNRKIFIIKGYSKDDTELYYDETYIEYYHSFFCSNAGGAYESNEIIYLKEPSVKDLKQLINNYKPDFAIIVLIGHGATQDDKQLFKLNENEIIKAGQLIFEIKKQLIIVESCRTETDNIYAVDLTDKLPKYRYGGYLRTPIDRTVAKERYIQQLMNCDDGIVICHACSKNEEAMNYYFSRSLIQISFDWHLNKENYKKNLSIQKLMNYLSKELPKFTLSEKGKQQKPEIIGSLDFPISICKF